MPPIPNIIALREECVPSGPDAELGSLRIPPLGEAWTVTDRRPVLRGERATRSVLREVGSGMPGGPGGEWVMIG